MLTSTTRRKRAASILALAAALALAAPVVEARPGSGSSGGMGSRGSRTYAPPSATTTAPGAPAPIQRSQTQPGPAMGNPGMTQAAQPGRRFGGGFMAGLLGAGLLGALLGGGFFGGLGGIMSFLGLILQVGLVVMLVAFAVRWFRRRQGAPAAAGHARQNLDAPGPMGGPMNGPVNGPSGGPMGGAPLGGNAQRGPAPVQPPAARPVQIGPGDFQSFEIALNDIQAAYGREDAAALRNFATPEMAGYFIEELQANQARGVVNRISDVKLLQGDLSESWGEGNAEYATVAMRYAIKDVTVDRRTDRVVETGEPEAVELWTFVRERGGRWILSAIQQGR
ncbi:TIM44-like domain-containing protein [Methylobacterium sp. J-078]|uniref:TIM44-like domain-containing protein n=1 Tax=Methylobacterium sp. J-078 TaxID=2836657 RepID=UPI001FB93D8C|nr:TIM44-like domain-containing protein [Methylobacterium sp. J-078]MCJ2047794.1 TIM44-like domain-containing protein [Methylobacterium sp. J-078]